MKQSNLGFIIANSPIPSLRGTKQSLTPVKKPNYSGVEIATKLRQKSPKFLAMTFVGFGKKTEVFRNDVRGFRQKSLKFSPLRSWY
jgi:hypothetical protein